MEESLGSGFDSIRAAILSPTSFTTRVTVSPVFTQTTTDLERPSYVHLAGAESSIDSERLDLFSNHPSDRVDAANTARATYSNEIEYSERGVHSGGETNSDTRNEEISQTFPGFSPFHMPLAGSSEHQPGLEQVMEHELYAQSDLMEWNYSLPQSEHEYESDESDDTLKFYTGPGLHIRQGNDDEEDSEDWSEDYDSDIHDEHPPLRQMLTSLNRYDHRYNRYWDGEQPDLGNPHLDTHLQTTQERNLTVEQFIKRWMQASLTNSIYMPSQFPGPSLEAANVLEWLRPRKIVRPQDIDPGEFYDIQQIPWREKLGVRREDARILRDAWYSPYSNLDFTLENHPSTLPKRERYFHEKALYTDFRATIEHFQLRNLMAVTSFNTLQFAYESQLLSWTPDYRHVRCVMDLSRPAPETGFQGPVKISTMQSKHGISVAGGFNGEYCMHINGSRDDNAYGLVTTNPNGITNNIDIIRSRTESSPLVVFASNDQHIRTLNCARNQFFSDHELPIPVNCSETSADGRLRIVVGDSPDAYVLEADSGRALRKLCGHRDFGFACAWSPDMLHIATSNQDRTVNIWDVRMWRILQSMDSDSAGYRSLRFSPIGGGPRTLLMSEPADRIAIVNATTFETRQVHDFFGEIGGADYTPDGGSIWIANTDEIFGGFMKFDRMQYGQRYGSSRSASLKVGHEEDPYEFAPEWYSDFPHEWASEDVLESDPRCVVSRRERDLRVLNGLSDEARDNLLI